MSPTARDEMWGGGILRMENAGILEEDDDNIYSQDSNTLLFNKDDNAGRENLSHLTTATVSLFFSMLVWISGNV